MYVHWPIHDISNTQKNKQPKLELIYQSAS